MDVYFFLILVIISLANGVKVKMQGTLSLGQDVMDRLSNFIRINAPDGRRSELTKDPDVLYLMIKASYLCTNLEFCDGVLENFVNEYISFQTRAMEVVFKTVQHPDIDYESLYSEHNLKLILGTIRNLFITINKKITEHDFWILWIEALKRISAVFQETAVVAAIDQLMSAAHNPVKNEETKKKLNQNFITATVIIEGRFETKLCAEYDICTKYYECTKTLDVLLGNLINMEDGKVSLFVRYFSEALLDTPFYSKLSEVTANALQIILDEMSYTKNVPTKEVLTTIHKAVVDRLRGIVNKEYTAEGRHMQLLHSIMSDLDYAYSNRSIEPFHTFMVSFYDWKMSSAKLTPSIRKVLSDIGDQLLTQPLDVITKINVEVQAFLELTVDPEK